MITGRVQWEKPVLLTWQEVPVRPPDGSSQGAAAKLK
jgi:hypothetical protein